MPSLLERLWYTSLATLAARVQRWSHRLRESEKWLMVNGGRVSLARHKPLLIVEVHHICVMFSLVPLLLELGYSLEILDREHATPRRCFIAAF